jgi:hypothetical protein
MTTAIHELYKRFRKQSPFMLVGENARLALDSAKTLAEFRRLEASGLVKIEAELDQDPDASFYDTWPHLSERSREELKQQYYNDCWVVSTSVRCNCCEQWKEVDTICGCSGYNDPCSPFENCYVIDLMQSAIEARTH